MYGWLTQSAIPGRLTLAISLPNSEAWQADFLGAFLALTEARNWEEHGTLSSEEMADEWRAVFFDFVNGVASMIPVGSIMAFGGSSAPGGFFLCNGDAVSRFDFAGLFSVIGTSYGHGNGTTTFGLPDLQGKVPVGRITLIPSLDTLGETGGAMGHVLTTAELPAHLHTAVVATGVGGNQGPMNVVPSHNGTGAAGQPWNSSSVGSGASHNNMPPYQVVNYIIKY